MNAHALAAESVPEPEPGLDEWLAHCEAVESTASTLRATVGREVRR